MTKKIVWINGAFGAGKTTVATAVRAKWDGAILFNPEEVGGLVRKVVPSDLWIPSDFQDNAIWRDLVVDVADRLIQRYRQPLIMRMTVLRPPYFDEIMTGLLARGHDVRHFMLVVPRDVVVARLEGRGTTAHDLGWAMERYDRDEESFSAPQFAEHVEYAATDPVDAADRILASIRGG